MIEIVSLKSNNDYTLKKRSEEGNLITEMYEEYDIMPNSALEEMQTDISPMKGNKFPTITSARRIDHPRISQRRGK